MGLLLMFCIVFLMGRRMKTRDSEIVDFRLKII